MNEILQFNDPVGTIVGFKITSSDFYNVKRKKYIKYIVYQTVLF